MTDESSANSQTATRALTGVLGLLLLLMGLERMFFAIEPQWSAGISLTLASLVAFYSTIFGKTILDIRTRR